MELLINSRDSDPRLSALRESRHGLFVILDIANFSLRSATELMNTTLH